MRQTKSTSPQLCEICGFEKKHNDGYLFGNYHWVCKECIELTILRAIQQQETGDSE